MAMMGPPLVSYLSLDKWLDSRCRWPIYTGRYECVRCSVTSGCVFGPSSLLKSGLAAPNLLSDWGLHEKYHSKQTLGRSRGGARGICHGRRGEVPERSKR